MQKRNKLGVFITVLEDKVCPVCNKEFHPRIEKTKTCSNKCKYIYRSVTYKPTKETLKKRSIALKKVKRTKEWRDKTSKALIGNNNGHGCLGKPNYKMRGKNNPRWKGGVGRHNRDRKTLEYKNWLRAIFKRDNYTCQDCGEKGGRIEAHHIKSWELYPKLRFNIKNGQTLCKECHQVKTKEYLKKNWKNQYRSI